MCWTFIGDGKLMLRIVLSDEKLRTRISQNLTESWHAVVSHLQECSIVRYRMFDFSLMSIWCNWLQVTLHMLWGWWIMFPTRKFWIFIFTVFSRACKVMNGTRHFVHSDVYISILQPSIPMKSEYYSVWKIRTGHEWKKVLG